MTLKTNEHLKFLNICIVTVVIVLACQVNFCASAHRQVLPQTPWPTLLGSGASKDYFAYNDSRVHRTDSSIYPTTPAGDKEFIKWEQEQEKKYSQEMLQKLINRNRDSEYKLNQVIEHLMEDKVNKLSESTEVRSDDEQTQSPSTEAITSSTSRPALPPVRITTPSVPVRPPPRLGVFPVFSPFYENLAKLSEAVAQINPVPAILQTLNIADPNNSNPVPERGGPLTNFLNSLNSRGLVAQHQNSE